ICERCVKVEDMAGFGAFHADGRGDCCLPPGRAILLAARNVLGADYNHRDHAIFAGRRIRSVHAAFFRNGTGGGSWGDCGDLPRAYAIGICHERVRPGAALRRSTLGTKCISIRRCRAGDRAATAAESSCMASRVPSLCRSVDRDWRGAAIDAGMAGSGRQMMKDLNSIWQRSICLGPLLMESGARAEVVHEDCSIVAHGFGADHVDLRSGYASVDITVSRGDSTITRTMEVGPHGVDH